jgi:hypothetical protein
MVKFGQVRETLKKQSQKFHDEVVPLSAVSFDSLENVKIGENQYRLRMHAAMGMSARLHVPYRYLSRCSADLQARNLNYWVEKQKDNGSDLFISFDGEAVRAVFSKRYVPIDNMAIVDEMHSLGITEDVDVQFYFDQQFMMLNVPSPTKKFALLKKDEMMPGVSISNSEVGLASFSVAAFMLRLICTNGMVSKEHVTKSSYRHVSEKVLQNLPSILQDATSNLDVLQQSMKDALDMKVENPDELLLTLNDRYLLGEKQKEAVKWAWPQEQGATMFNVIQTYTRAVQFETLSAQERFRLQEAGGAILSDLKIGS